MTISQVFSLSPTSGNVLNYFGRLALLYSGVAIVSALVFVVGAGIYVAVIPAPAVDDIKTDLLPPNAVPTELPKSINLYELHDVMSSKDPNVGNIMKGAPIYDSQRKLIGHIIEVVPSNQQTSGQIVVVRENDGDVHPIPLGAFRWANTGRKPHLVGVVNLRADEIDAMPGVGFHYYGGAYGGSAIYDLTPSGPTPGVSPRSSTTGTVPPKDTSKGQPNEQGQQQERTPSGSSQNPSPR